MLEYNRCTACWRNECTCEEQTVVGGIFWFSARCKWKEKIPGELVGDFDPYESTKSEWQDNVNLWPSITHIHPGMYLLYSPSSYTREELLNYKSLDCYVNFMSGWVREVLVKVFDKKRVVIAKVIINSLQKSL